MILASTHATLQNITERKIICMFEYIQGVFSGFIAQVVGIFLVLITPILILFGIVNINL